MSAQTYTPPPRSEHVGGNDLGEYFLDSEGSLWKMVGYCDEPQATFQRIDGHGEGTWGRPASDNALVTHVVGCINHNEMGLRRLPKSKV